MGGIPPAPAIFKIPQDLLCLVEKIRSQFAPILQIPYVRIRSSCPGSLKCFISYMILIALGEQKGGRSFFGGGPVGARDGQNSLGCIVFGGKDSLSICLHPTNSLGKD